MRLVAQGIWCVIGQRLVVDRADLVAEPGHVTALIGPNGAGKTSLLGCLSGTLRPRAGKVMLGDRDVTRLREDTRARRGLGRTFQNPEIFRSLTVEENLRVAAENRSRGGLFPGLLGLPDPGRAAAGQRVTEVLQSLGLAGFRHRRAGGLPTGMLRLVELARALAGRPSALLLDEPAAGLSEAETVRLAQTLRRVASDGVSVLLVEHDLRLVFEVADVVHVMASGRMLASGAPQEIRSESAVRAVLDLPE